MTFESVDAALEHADKARELRIDCSQLSAIPRQIGELQALRHLRLDHVHEDVSFPASIAALEELRSLAVTGPEDCSAPFPEIFVGSSITDLRAKHFRANDLAPLGAQLKRLHLSSYFIFEDMEPLFAHLTELEYLEIWGFFARDHNREKAQLELPPTIANLRHLEELEIVSAGLRTLPIELEEMSELRAVRLRNHPFRTFPGVLTRIPSLAELEFAQMSEIVAYPDELADMNRLKQLDLAGSWNGGALPSRWDDVDYAPLPGVLGELEGLESLALDGCAVPDLAPLAGLSNLEVLSVDWGAFEVVSPLSALISLKSLSLKHAWVEDLSPLAGLEELQTLDIRDAKADDQAPSALEPLIGLPKLDTVHSNEVSAERWRAMRDATAIAPDEVVDRLESGDLDQVRAALADIVGYSEARSTHEQNALLQLFDLDRGVSYDPAVVEYAPLDDALGRWLEDLADEELAALAAATFTSTSDGWNATLVALRELGRRDALDAQLVFVEAWFAATAYYDGGHRHRSDTVHDQLIDDIWETFDARALAALLAETPEDQLDSEYGDGMDALFVPALTGLDAPHEGLMDKVRAYAFRNLDDVYGTSPGETLAMLEAASEDAAPSVADELRRITEEMRAEMNASR